MQIVHVRLRKPTRVFPFLCDGLDLARADACIVRTDRGLEYGICISPPSPCGDEAEERVSMSVVRKATLNDEHTLHQIEQEERKARDLCARKIAEHHLPMKLVDAEYTFDRHRVTFYFTAADRVDFRELVRQLAQELRARIELRHIPVRDEARIVGGIGVCGLTLCCATWLREFQPISMKMAKRQNLSLNPAKISGQCGRLLCCLSYENELYPGKKDRSAPESEVERRLAEWDLGASEEAAPELDEEAAEEALAAEKVEAAESIEFSAEDIVGAEGMSDSGYAPTLDEHPGRERIGRPEEGEAGAEASEAAESPEELQNDTQQSSLANEQRTKRRRRRRGRRHKR